MASRPAIADPIDALKRRASDSIDRLARGLPAEQLLEALASVDEIDFFTRLARAAPLTGDKEISSLNRRQLAGIDFKRRLGREGGGLLPASDAQELLGYRSRQALYKAVRERRLLMVEDGGRQLFPACQFDGNAVRPGVVAVLKAASGSGGWAVLQYLLSRPSGLGGERPIDLVAGDPAMVDRAVRFARRLED